MSNYLKTKEKTGDSMPPHWSQFLTYRLHTLSSSFRNQTAEILAQTGLLPTQWNIIALMVADKITSSRELLKASDFGKALVSRTLTGMEENGIIDRFRDANDKRVDRFTLTKKGFELYEVAKPIMEARRLAVQDCISDEDREAAERIFDALDKVVQRRSF